MRRAVDIVIGAAFSVLTSPLVAIGASAIWAYDRASPIYRATRVGRDGVPFTMYKLRSMRPDSGDTGVDSTALDDPRLTPPGRVVRTLKLDELPQLLNVLRGEMTLVGPRPNVIREVAKYTDDERRLLSVKPGLTDLASIGFADLAAILDGTTDANADYERLVRPWKSALGLFYIEHRTAWLDVQILCLTVLAIPFRDLARRLLVKLLGRRGADPTLMVAVARRPMAPARA